MTQQTLRVRESSPQSKMPRHVMLGLSLVYNHAAKCFYCLELLLRLHAQKARKASKIPKWKHFTKRCRPAKGRSENQARSSCCTLRAYRKPLQQPQLLLARLQGLRRSQLFHLYA